MRSKDQIRRQKVQAKQRRKAALAARGPRPQVLTRLASRAAVQIAAAAGDAPRTFRIAAYTGEPMTLYGWPLPVVVDLATVDLTEQQIPALYDHWDDILAIVGQVNRLAVEEGILVASGLFTLTGDAQEMGAQVLAKADAGYRWQASIGGDPASVEEIQPGESATVNGRTYPGPVMVARGVKLREISFVVLGGDRRTSAVVARLKGSASMSFEEFCQSKGFDPAALDDTQRANMMEMYREKYPEDDSANAADGNTTPDQDPPANARAARPAVQARGSDGLARLRADQAREVARVNEITRLCAAAGNPLVTIGSRANVDLAAHAIESGWDAATLNREIELHQLRASRAQGPAGFVRDSGLSAQTLEASLLLRAGADWLQRPAYGSIAARGRLPEWLRAGVNDPNRNRILDAAHRYSDRSLSYLCEEALRLEGRAFMHMNQAEMIRAAFSGSTLTNIFTTNINAILLASYMEAGNTTEGWTQVRDVENFMLQERPRVEVGDGLAKLPRGGTADHAKYSDVAESYRIARYAKQFVVDEQDIIDDNLGALSDVPMRLGTAAARLCPDLVYAILLANPNLTATSRPLLNTTDGNYVASGSALAASTLKVGIAAMRKFQENGVNLNINPTHLIVPPTLEWTGLELMDSATIVLAGTAGSVTERGSANVLKSRLQVVADARIENTLVDPSSGTSYSGSSTRWYLAAAGAHTIEVGYRRGTGRAPMVRSWKIDKEGQYGLGWDVAMDIGAKAMDWKGLYSASS